MQIYSPLRCEIALWQIAMYALWQIAMYVSVISALLVNGKDAHRIRLLARPKFTSSPQHARKLFAYRESTHTILLCVTFPYLIYV